jgi:hypothetical protein
MHMPVPLLRPLLRGLVALVAALPALRGAPGGAATAAEDAAEGSLRAGAAASNITPPLGVSLNGGMADRKATYVHDELHARALVLDDGARRIAFVICDSCMIPREVIDIAKARASELAGIPADHVLVAATHTHSAPAAASVFQSDADEEYRRFLAVRIGDAVARAASNLRPARAAWGAGKVPQHVFNRRWRLRPGSMPPNPFGSRDDGVKMNPPRASPDLVEPASPVDPELWVLSVEGTDGRPLAVLANYSLHYVGGEGAGHVSADYFGAFAERLEEALGASRLDPPFVGILSNGTSGDVNNIDFRVPGAERQPYEAMRLVAAEVAAEALRVVRSLEHRERLALGALRKDLRLGVRRPTAAEMERAKAVLAAHGGGPLRTLEEIYARETVLLAAYPEEVEVPLQALRAGDLAIAAIPCEVFVEIGLDIKAESPFPASFTIELANGYNGYLPTVRHHELGGYETWRARSSYLEVNAAPKITQEVLALLQALRAESR